MVLDDGINFVMEYGHLKHIGRCNETSKHTIQNINEFMTKSCEIQRKPFRFFVAFRLLFFCRLKSTRCAATTYWWDDENNGFANWQGNINKFEWISAEKKTTQLSSRVSFRFSASSFCINIIFTCTFFHLLLYSFQYSMFCLFFSRSFWFILDY